MKKTTQLIALCGTLAAVPFTMADTTLMTDLDFALGMVQPNEGPWIAGANQFLAGSWIAFSVLEIPDQVTVNGNGTYTFSSWDDGSSDTLETYLFQEFNAGQPGSGQDSIFATGDVIKFKGTATSTFNGNTQPKQVRAFLKVLGFVNGNANQVLGTYTTNFNLDSTTKSWDMTLVFPDISAGGGNDNLQVVQMGFELTTTYNGSSMDSGTITFSNLEGYVEGGAATTFQGYDIIDGTWIDTGDYMGFLYIEFAPWIYSTSLQSWIYLPESSSLEEAGAWIYIPQ